jgi:hypothetical protein
MGNGYRVALSYGDGHAHTGSFPDVQSLSYNGSIRRDDHFRPDHA